MRQLTPARGEHTVTDENAARNNRSPPHTREYNDLISSASYTSRSPPQGGEHYCKLHRLTSHTSFTPAERGILGLGA